MIQREHFERSAGWGRNVKLFTSKQQTRTVIAVLGILIGVFGALVPVDLAKAASPTLSWVDDSTIKVTGDPLLGSYSIVTVSNPSNGLSFYGSTDVQHQDACWLNLTIGISAGANGGATDWSKAYVQAIAPSDSRHNNCNLPSENPKKTNDPSQYDLGFKNGQTYTLANVENRSNSGEPQAPTQVDDPEANQIVKVRLNTGWDSVYTTPNPSNPPKDSEIVPKEDLWILCGNAADPPRGWDAYRDANTGTPDYQTMENNCKNRLSGFVINTTRGSMQTKDRNIWYEGEFTGVKWGNYVACDYITNSCVSFSKEANKIKTIDTWPLPANPNADVPGSETDAEGTVEEPELACDATFSLTKIYDLKWIVCPFVNGATATVGWLEDAINDLLTVGVKDIFDDTAGDNAFHKAWNSFRYFALGLIVIAALIMVVSQAAGVEILDAYTVRKVLPRLLFASIFIALSWDILEFLVQLSNDAGTGIRVLIYAPFQALNADSQLGGGSTVVLALIGTGGALAFGWIGLLSFAVTGLLAVLVGFAVLVFRKMLILLLIMMAPFAIAAYVLPNTNKLWDLWKTGLLSVLIVFPIITAFVAIGRVFAITSLNAGGSKTINHLIAIVAYFAPYFMISMAFRMAGGFMATVGGFANDKSRGAFDRLKNFRGNKMNENMAKMASGTRFQGSNPLARGFNATTFGATTFAKSRSKLGFLTNSNVRRSSFEQQRSLNAMKYAQSDMAKVAKDNDGLLRAQTYANEATARQNMAADFGMDENAISAAIAAARANGGFGRDQQLNATRALFATGTGFESQEQASMAIKRTAGNNRDLAAALAGYGNAETGKQGRNDLKVGFAEYMSLYDDATASSTGRLGADRYEEATMKAIEGNDAITMSRGKPIALKNTMPVLEKQLHAQQALAAQTGTLYHKNGQLTDDLGRTVQQAAREQAGRIAGIIEQYQNASAYASPVNIQTVDERVVQPTQNVRVTSAATAPTADEARGYTQQKPRSAIDPNDPNRQGP